MWFLAGLALYFWPYVLGGVAVILLVLGVRWLLSVGREDLEARRKARAAVVARADQQHAWILGGDTRGLYGRYPPAK